MDDGGEQVVEHAMGHSGSHKLPEGQHAALVGSTPAKQARQALSEAVQHAGLFAGHLALHNFNEACAAERCHHGKGEAERQSVSNGCNERMLELPGTGLYDEHTFSRRRAAAFVEGCCVMSSPCKRKCRLAPQNTSR